VNGLHAEAHQALLDLYALDTRLQTAQARLTLLSTQARRLRAQQILVRQELAATAGTLKASQSQLETNLRLLYKQGDVSTLGVLLGAQNLDEAVTKLDALSNMADESQNVMQTASAAQARLEQLRASLRQRRATIDTDIRGVQEEARSLASTRAARLSFIAQLHTKERLKQTQIKELQVAATRVERKSNAIQASAAAVPDPARAVDPAVTAPASTGQTLVVSSTGYSLPGNTSTGIPVGWGVIAVDPAVIPLGSRLSVPGYGEGVAADTGSAVRGADIDLWFPTPAQARAWGRRTVTITLH
jgi:3D (Asp-Asp-Asp) domain-containing protein